MRDEELARRFAARRVLLEGLALTLEGRVTEALIGLPHVDRVSFRVKGTDSFVAKASRAARPAVTVSARPLRDIEDQVAGRVIVFFRCDLTPVTDRLAGEFTPVEQVRKEPLTDDAFGYESEHLINVIPEHLKPPGWEGDPEMPTTFEMQVRTLFMHAWAEPQHDLGYKPRDEVSSETKRKLAWIAASAWGADHVLNDVHEQMTKRSPVAPDA